MFKIASEIWHLASLTALEARRNRVVPAMALAMLVLLATGTLLASVTMGRSVDIVVDFGLAGMTLLTNLLAIFITVQGTQQERENRTLFVLLPHLHSRSVYVVGKFVGTLLVLTGVLLLLGLLLLLFVAPLGWHNWPILLEAFFALFLEIAIITACALLFTNSSSLFLAILFTLSVDVTGRFTFVIKKFGEQFGGGVQWLTDAAYYLLPNMEILNLRNRITDSVVVPPGELVQMALYAGSETGLLLVIACLLFSNKDVQNT